MQQAAGFECPGCGKTLFGLGWRNGQRVIFSNCTCVKKSGDPLKFVFLTDAVSALGPEKKVSVPEEHRLRLVR